MTLNSIKHLEVEQLEKTAESLKVIAHPVRISILGLLEDGAELTVSEIQAKLGLEQAPTSHHLGLLKTRGILLSKRVGRNTLYALDKDNLQSILCCFRRCANEVE